MTAAQEIDDLSAVAVDVVNNSVYVGVDDPDLKWTSEPIPAISRPKFGTTSNGERIDELLEQTDNNRPRNARAKIDRAIARHTDVTTIVEYEATATPSACYSRKNCPTTASEEFRGGLLISRPGTCTTGFMATAKDNPSLRLMVTAGHCDFDPANRDRRIGGQNPGAAFTGANTIREGNSWTTADRDVDAAAMQVSETRFGNRIYKSSQYRSWFINDTDNRNNQGELVCTSGVTIDYRCGLVTYSTKTAVKSDDPDVIARGGGMNLTRQMWFDITRVGHDLSEVPGSSGGPVTGSPNYNHTKRDALGILARATSNNETMEDGLKVTKNTPSYRESRISKGI